ncbi:hemerythrin domain-containing protein [Kitasatospora sp. NPDC057542]|uniref:hemerythrin domain-containing protein n=1 Tax=Streptomycetaceae TaxID=2062 RepID=UPI001CD021AE|nr:hemerythrin domain-containing protein [Streptomyces sp. LS1784]
MASPSTGRTAALSLQLSLAHRDLRRRLDGLRTDLGRPRRPGGDDNGLLTHCLAFCTALTNHHQGEDTGLFAQLLRERPDLAPTIGRLVEDHGLITHILTRVRELADRAADIAAADASAGGATGSALEPIGRELDGLAAIMDSHFAYEERAIGAALDAGVSDDGWSEPVLRFGPPRSPAPQSPTP